MAIKVNVKKIFAYMFGFILLYQPNYPININLFFFNLRINNYILLLIFVLLYLFHYIIYRKNIFRLLNLKKYLAFVVLIFLATLYYVCRTAFAGTSFTDIKNLRIVQNLFPIVYMFAALIINNELNEMNYSTKDKCKFIINLAIIQAAIAILMLVFPSLKKIAITIYGQGAENVNIYVAKNRLHGICDGDYTYSFQILHSILALLSLIYAYTYGEKKYYIYTLLILLVTFLNGRTGILIFGAGLFIYIIILFFKSHNLNKFLKFLLIIFVMIFSMYKIISICVPSAARLVRHAILDISSFREGNDDTETSQLYNMIKFPEGISLILGEGYRVYGQKGIEFGDTFYSDIGFVNDFYMGGLIYVSLLYGAYLNLIIQEKKTRNNLLIYSFTLLLIASLLLANIKGEVFRSVTLQVSAIFISILLGPINKPIKEIFRG